MQHMRRLCRTVLLGLYAGSNDDGDENNDVLFENRDVSSSFIILYHQMGPGDTVWWHPDLLHYLEEWNTSSSFNSVLYLSG